MKYQILSLYLLITFQLIFEPEKTSLVNTQSTYGYTWWYKNFLTCGVCQGMVYNFQQIA